MRTVAFRCASIDLDGGCLMEMSEIYSETFWRLFEALDVSLEPTGPDALHDIGDHYLSADDRVLDVGCRDASHLIRLVRHAGSGVGIDPVPWHVQRATARVAATGLAHRVEIVEAVAENIPFPDESFDAVWCRDVVEVLPDLQRAFAQMARVLRPDGHVIVYTNVLNGEPVESETKQIHEPLGNVVGNLVEANLQRAFNTSGLEVSKRIIVGTEWREFMEEREGSVSRDLLRLARLRRQQDQVIAGHGRQAYETAQASLQWSAYQFLGRFVPVIYVLQKHSSLT